MKVPFHDLKRQYKSIEVEIQNAIQPVFESTAFAGGTFVEQFENNLSKYNNTKYAVGVNSGTSALHLALLALDIKSGDEIIIPANTFIASAWAPSYIGAVPVFVDCDSSTWNIDPKKIEEKITKNTKAIIGVHLYGQPFEIDEVKKICKQYNLLLIEDNAQAIGARYKGNITGTLSDIGCTSFYPGKNLGAYGEGGAIVTNNEGYAKHIKKLRNHGCEVRYYHDEIGYNMRMDGIQGAILNLKLKYIDEWNGKRKHIAKRYQTEIKNPHIKMQKQIETTDSVYHLFVVTTENRDDLAKSLDSFGVSTALHYPVPCHLQKAYSFLNYKVGDIPNAEYLANHCLSLPMFSELTEEEVSYVIEKVNGYKK